MWIGSKLMTVPGSLHTGFPNGALNASGAQITFTNCPPEVKLLLIETPEIYVRDLPLNLNLFLFLHPSHHQLTTTGLFSVSVTLILFCCVCSFVLHFRFHLYVKSNSICLSLSYLPA